MAQQGYPPQGQPPAVDNNMTMSIVAIFLFWPLAIPAIINASKVNPALQVGNYAEAQRAAAESKKWSKLALWIGIGWYVLVAICCVIYIVALGGLAASTAVTTTP